MRPLYVRTPTPPSRKIVAPQAVICCVRKGSMSGVKVDGNLLLSFLFAINQSKHSLHPISYIRQLLSSASLVKEPLPTYMLGSDPGI